MYTEIFTDGALSKKSKLDSSGMGGWGFVRLTNGRETILERYGYEDNTTSQRMELVAAIESLKDTSNDSYVILTSDSKYLVDSINKGYLKSWIKSKSLDDRPNADLWRLLIKQIKRMKSIKFKWVKGHNGNVFNERADQLAGMGKELLKKRKNENKDI